ncbi:MAG: hypothetical protein ACPG4N_13905, partial [Gammaproteobacteria bacterium]
RQAEKEARESGLSTAIRRRYAWVIPAAVNLPDKYAVAELDQDTLREIDALFDDLRERNPDAPEDVLRTIMSDEARRCIAYWEDGTPADKAVRGLNLMADHRFRH